MTRFAGVKCSAATIAPYLKHGLRLFWLVKSAITGRPLYVFCIDWLLGSKYAGCFFSALVSSEVLTEQWKNFPRGDYCTTQICKNVLQNKEGGIFG
jgi:hypothetical protein